MSFKTDNPQEFAACMAMDAFRICVGQKPRNFTVADIIRWLELSAKASKDLAPLNNQDGR